VVHLKFFGSVQRRDILAVEIFLHGGLRAGAERAEQREHFLLLDQTPRRLDGLRRAVGIVQRQERDLAPVDSALLVQHLEIRRLGAADHAIKRPRPGMRYGLAELDLSVARARIVFLLRVRGGCSDQNGSRERGTSSKR